jgi:hypothetical protein
VFLSSFDHDDSWWPKQEPALLDQGEAAFDKRNVLFLYWLDDANSYWGNCRAYFVLFQKP